MSISSVSSIASSLIGAATTSDSSASSDTSLEKQKQVLEQEIQKETQSGDDATTKAQKLKDYNQQLAKMQKEIDAQSSSTSSSGSVKAAGTTSGLVDESA